jgi:hypothetical protein
VVWPFWAMNILEAHATSTILFNGAKPDPIFLHQGLASQTRLGVGLITGKITGRLVVR